MTVPCLVVAAPRSGEGKTTVALGLMAALRRRGLRVQGFKVGPDYLDTTHQALATGRPGRNLDLWLMGESGVRNTFAQATRNADVAIVEGVMGLFDGHRDGVTPTSTADVAKLLQAPVLLVLDASHAAASTAAVALGFKNFDPEVSFAGALLNRWRGHRSRTAIEAGFLRTGLPLLGYLEPRESLVLPSRHLGILGAPEMGEAATKVIENVATEIEASLPLEALLDRLPKAACLDSPLATPSMRSEGPIVGVARDEAFFFYYPENLEALAAAGARIVEVSPLRDPALPPELDALYLGGGYPEVHASALAANTSFLSSLRVAADAGLPLYAECGGLMYLTRAVTDGEGRRWPLVGLVPGEARMHPRLQSMGYREARLTNDGYPGPAGTVVRGHEFHYSSISYDAGTTPAYEIDGRPEGHAAGNVLASYLHLHFSGCPDLPLRFVASAAQYRSRHRRTP